MSSDAFYFQKAELIPKLNLIKYFKYEANIVFFISYSINPSFLKKRIKRPFLFSYFQIGLKHTDELKEFLEFL